MPLNINNKQVEELAEEVARLTGESKTGSNSESTSGAASALALSSCVRQPAGTAAIVSGA
jgi:hypothetical protein